MKNPEPTISVKVDMTNPGQFFACCGLLELADRLWPGAEGWFEGDRFLLYIGKHVENALYHILKKLSESTLDSDKSRGQGPLHPVRIEAFGLSLDWWIDGSGDKTPLKLWAGNQTSIGIMQTLQEASKTLLSIASSQVFDADQQLSGRFGVDPRAAWNALDIGFSPNTQSMKVASFPIVEMLAAAGLQRFRPVLQEELCLSYSTWGIPLPVLVAPIASRRMVLKESSRQYRFEITKRGSYKGFGYANASGEMP